MASQDPNAPVADVESAMAARVDPARNGPASLARAWVRGVVAVGVLVVVAVLGFQATRPTYSSGDFMQHAPVTTASGTAPRQLAAASWIDRLFGLDRKAAASFPLVTVMVVTRNRPHFLAHAVFNIMQQDYPNLEVVIIDDSQQPLVASPTALPAPSAGLQPPVGAIHDPVTALRGLLLGDAATASEHVAAAEYTELANAPAGSARTFRYYHFDRQMAIGEKRNQAASRANGVVVVTWDDDDLFRTHRITKQVEPVLAGHCEITTLAHGLYMYASSQRYFNWSLSSPAERSPHFGTLAYATAMWRSGVHYPSTSFGEDYGFAERALDAGYRLRTLDNIDGTFVYVRHGKAGPGDTRTQAAGNTWQISAELQQALLRNLKPIHTPLWLSPTSHDFFDLLHRQALQQASQERVLRADKVATKAPAVKAAAPTKSHPNGALNYHLPADLHGQHKQLNWHLTPVDHAKPQASYVRRRRLGHVRTHTVAARRRTAVSPFCAYAQAYPDGEAVYGYGYPHCFPTVVVDASASLDGNGIMANTTVNALVQFSAEVEGFRVDTLQVSTDDDGVRFSARTMVRIDERTWRVQFTILTISPERTKMVLTMHVPAGVVSPSNKASNMEQVKFGPPMALLTSDQSPSTKKSFLTVVATFVDAWNQLPKPVTGMHVASFNLVTTPPNIIIKARSLDVPNPPFEHAWRLALELEPPLQRHTVTLTFNMDAREGGLVPFNAPSPAPLVIEVVPAVAVVSAMSGGVAVGDGLGVDAGSTVIVFSAVVDVALDTIPDSVDMWTFDLDKYINGATVENMDPEVLSNSTVLKVKVTLPTKLWEARIVARLSGDAAVPHFVSPDPFTVTYKCAAGTTAGCSARHDVFKAPPAGGTVSVEGALLTQIMHSRVSVGGYTWSYLPALSTPSPSFTGITGTATVNKETMSISNVPPGYYTFVLTADIGRHAGAATTVPTRRVSVLMTLAVFDLKLAFTPPSGLYSGQSFQITYRSWLPADASVFLSIVDTSNTRQWSLTLPSLPGSASDLQRERTVTASVPVTTPTQSLRVVAQAVAHPAYSAGAADITLSLEASTTVLTRTPFSVAATTWSECSVPCGPGTRSRTLECFDIRFNPATKVVLSNCEQAGLAMPTTVSTCNLGACSATWWYSGPWGTCSETCGSDGIQTRTVECRTAAGDTVPDTDCTEAKPVTQRGCNNVPCASYEWSPRAWGECDKQCGAAGSGRQYRNVYCLNPATLATVDPARCTATKPATQRACDPPVPCNADTYFYSVRQPSACSAPCGGGTSTRNVVCVNGNNVVQADLSPCQAQRGDPPATTVPCNTDLCYSVRASEWSQCSASCGATGMQDRTLQCVYLGSSVRDLGECEDAGISMPATQKPCNRNACPDVFCVGNDCTGHGSCSIAEQRCVCDSGWHGTYCETPPQCSTGEVLDVGLNCCASGILSPNGTCCVSGTLDSRGECCPPTKPYRDACGRCNAQETQDPPLFLDDAGKCCDATQVDAEWHCCDGVLDNCNVCDGQDLCPVEANMQISGDDLSSMEAYIFAALGLQSRSTVTIDFLGSQDDRLRRLDSVTDAKLRVTPDPDPAPPNLAGKIVDLLGSGIANTTILGVDNVEVAPECGNDMCEVGEGCTDDGQPCCLADCPVARKTCPVSANQAAASGGVCSGRGNCDSRSGECTCFEGYTGAACDVCSVGYTRPTGNQCVSLASIKLNNQALEDQNNAANDDPAPTDDGATTTDDAAEGTGSEDTSGSSDNSSPVLLTTEEWFVIFIALLVCLFLLCCLCYLCCFSGTDAQETPKMMPMGPYPYPYPGYGHPGYGQQPGQPGQGFYPQHPAAQTKVAPAVPGFGQGDPQVHTVSPLNHATPRATGNGNPASLPQPQQQPQQQRALVLPEDPAVTQARRSAASLRTNSHSNEVMSDDDDDVVRQMAAAAVTGAPAPPGSMATPARPSGLDQPNTGRAGGRELPPLRTPRRSGASGFGGDDDPVALAALLAEDDRTEARPATTTNA